ncbi:hypothetical protein MPTK1_8g13260 [Marchantia polymorpha subsp. ruderalis]|uniref:Uncharacterized protein n=1 Tax=Marchantia polymorpha TaxID=3197 RepID=A0A2R6WCD6_MARPO|nr:hypothetical protein MARPO_0110s0007 [Marchantia polymorpha]BBN19746.1 hypothetical protein Mp_8g13260 [Marchantia polymorpha subsp. ruderalis]|eukprot:PTQ31513.1 hypothetical protein MARPO_0110s0007 [Marchantia polymorpha]
MAPHCTARLCGTGSRIGRDTREYESEGEAGRAGRAPLTASTVRAAAAAASRISTRANLRLCLEREAAPAPLPTRPRAGVLYVEGRLVATSSHRVPHHFCPAGILHWSCPSRTQAPASAILEPRLSRPRARSIMIRKSPSVHGRPIGRTSSSSSWDNAPELCPSSWTSPSEH